MAAADFSVELNSDGALIRCLTAGARSVAYELDRDDDCPTGSRLERARACSLFQSTIWRIW